MKVTRRATQIWNWLPAFRAVAEAEHLPTASKEANLSPSALSRSVKLLEEDLGVDLFVREGRALELTEAGRRLLGASRSAMRAVEAALDQVLSSDGAGDVHIAAPGPYASVFVLPALRRLRAAYPELVPHLSNASAARGERLLAEGALDIAVVDRVEDPTAVRVTKLGELGYSVYAGADHPLVGQLEVTTEDVLAHPFVGAPDHLIDHWPPHLHRRLGMVVEQLHVAVQACALDGMLGVLPDVVAGAYVGEGMLLRLPIDLVPPQPLYAISRRAAAEPKRINLVLTAIAQTFEDIKRGTTRRSTVPPARSTVRPPPLLDRSFGSPRAPRELALETFSDDDDKAASEG